MRKFRFRPIRETKNKESDRKKGNGWGIAQRKVRQPEKKEKYTNAEAVTEKIGKINRNHGFNSFMVSDLNADHERSIVMYIRERSGEGIPGRLYRSPSEIKRDMAIIEEKIREVEDKLSVRNLISALMESGDGNGRLIDEDTISTLETIMDNAERSLFHLERLRDGINYLEEELSEVRWLMKKNA